MNKNEIIEILKNEKEELQLRYKADLRGVFGSVARDEANDDSDIDILAEFKLSATLLDISGVKNYLEEKLKHKVDILSTRAIKPRLEPYIYNELILL